MTTATIIPSLTNNPPSRANPAAFPTDGDSFLNDLPGVVQGANTAATELNTWNAEVETFKNQANSSQTNAANSSATSLTQARNAAASMVSLWVSGTTYPAGQIVYSNVDGREYKRITAGAGTTDPSSDTANWEPLGWEYITNYPDIRPTLDLNFAGSQTVDPRITFTRNSTATYFDKFGVMQTAGTNQPRIDFDPVTGECKGLLIEEQRTNLLTYSEQFDNAAWDKLNATITADATVAPSGGIAADLVIPAASNATHGVRQSSSSTATSSVMSAYVKAGGYNRVQLYMFNGGGYGHVTFDLVSATVTHTVSGTVTGVSGTISSVGNGWFRITMFGSGSTAITLGGVLVLDAAGNGSSLGPAFAGDGYSGIYIWGAQLEAGSFPTSYIPTTSAQATRAADSASMTGTNFSSWYRQDEGTLFVETRRTGTVQTSDEGAGVELASGEFQKNLIQLMYDAGSYNRVTVRVFSASGLLIFAGPANSPNFTVGEAARKFAAAIMSGGTALASNGSVGASYSETFTPPLVTMLSIKTTSYGAQGSDFNGYIKKISYYPKRLPNQILQAITQP